MTVLVVDDERLIRWALHEALASKGYRVLEAEDGETARQRLGEEEAQIGVVLLDLRLPDVEGLDLLRQLRREGYRGPVIVMTAFAEPRTAAAATAAGAYTMLRKPFTLSDALQAVDTALASTCRSSA